MDNPKVEERVKLLVQLELVVSGRSTKRQAFALQERLQQVAFEATNRYLHENYLDARIQYPTK